MTTKPETTGWPEKVYAYTDKWHEIEFMYGDRITPAITAQVEYVRDDIVAAREIAIIRAALEAAKHEFNRVGRTVENCPIEEVSDEAVSSVDPATILSGMEKK